MTTNGDAIENHVVAICHVDSISKHVIVAV